MNLFNVVFLIICLIHETSGNPRVLVPIQLQQSPFGVGVRAALSRSPNCRHRRRYQKSREEDRQCNRKGNEEGFTRYATVLHDEARVLDHVILPHVKVSKNSRRYEESDDQLDCSEGDLTPCARFSAQRASPYGSHTHKVIDHEVENPRGGGVAIGALPSTDTRGGVQAVRPLIFWESMVCGAVSRSVAQTIMHPANTMKTILQSSRGADRPTLAQLMRPDQFRMLTRGAGANFLLSVPHGAVNFAVLEFVRRKMNKAAKKVPALRERLDTFEPAIDFASSAISTICCSVVSTPQMMITDNIMAGNFPNLPSAVSGLYQTRGVVGFYRGWLPGLMGKIPSYALTWTFFQQLKRVRDMISDRPAKNVENTAMGCMASAASVCIMIPIDTIKTRLVTQMSSKAMADTAYKGIVDCAVRVAKEEGIQAFYRGLPPRLISVVPMIGIQFGVYEAMKKVMLQRNSSPSMGQKRKALVDRYGPEQALKEAAMEVAASPAQPLPAPQFFEKMKKKKKRSRWFGLKSD